MNFSEDHPSNDGPVKKSYVQWTGGNDRLNRTWTRVPSKSPVVTGVLQLLFYSFAGQGATITPKILRGLMNIYSMGKKKKIKKLRETKHED